MSIKYSNFHFQPNIEGYKTYSNNDRFFINTHRNRIIFIWPILFLCVLLSHKPAIAYYPEAKKDFFFITERSRLIWPQSDGKFVIYDNHTYPVTSGNQIPFISPLTNKFVPADIIIGNLPLTVFFRKNLINEDYLSNLLYANLKMKKILDEYARVQKSAHELIHEIENSEFDHYNTATHMPNSQPGTSPKDYEYKEKIENLRKWDGRNKRDKESARIYSNFATKIQHRTGDSLPKVKSSNISDSQKNNNMLMSWNYSINTTYNLTTNAANQYETREYPVESQNIAGNNYIYNHDGETPWLRYFHVKILNYLMDNKFEALIYLLLLFIPFFISTTSRSR